MIKTFGYSLGVLLSLFWLLNFTVGVFEIPDNLPIIGHLDEAAAFLLLSKCITELRKIYGKKKNEEKEGSTKIIDSAEIN